MKIIVVIFLANIFLGCSGLNENPAYKFTSRSYVTLPKSKHFFTVDSEGEVPKGAEISDGKSIFYDTADIYKDFKFFFGTDVIMKNGVLDTFYGLKVFLNGKEIESHSDDTYGHEKFVEVLKSKIGYIRNDEGSAFFEILYDINTWSADRHAKYKYKGILVENHVSKVTY